MPALSMHRAVVPTVRNGLLNLKHLLQQGAAHVEAKGLDEKVVTNLRLTPDMLPLRWQVYIATDNAKFAVKRLAEVDAPAFADDQETFADLIQRIDDTVAYLDSVDADALNGTEDKTVVMKRKSGDIEFTGTDYVFGYLLPNFYFHIATAHGLLRQAGVDIGKMDYLQGGLRR